ncbi:uncharacterized protein DUF4214 [Thermovibrio guaymasensis]|uniref:Uncharacterized protein DUF4214 n=1 Tax=Thermovibrio guaymasensis TaxID=240167 RepID=A0A420W687_9BACT|nr:DUF4214 domain-containing protein [Thermovibrio guaymasensis]RKQ60621.1 uncharacterized protein DUF4214 [Thermovibrio guaymasensis]
MTKTQVSQLYVTLFGRASEKEGNEYWATHYDNQYEAAKVMLTLDIVKDYFGDAWNDNKAFIESIYKNTLGKDPAKDQEGVNYWLNELNSLLKEGKSLTEARAKVVVDLINAVHEYENSNDPEAKAAALQFKNKVEVSDYTAEKVEKVPGKTNEEVLQNLKYFKEVIANVTDDPATVEAAKKKVDEDLVVKNVALTTGKDIIKGSVFDDTFKADLLTLNDGDSIDGRDGDDTLTAEINTNITDGVTIKNVENINVTSYGDNTIDFKNISGVKTFATVNSTGKITLNNVADASVAFKFKGQTTNDLEVNYKAGTLTGTNDALYVTFDNAKDVKLDVDSGFETFTITNTGTSSTDTLTVPGVSTLVIEGDGSIDFGDDLNGFKAIKASGFTGAVYTGKDTDNDGFAQNAVTGNSEGTSVFLGSGDDQIGFTDNAATGKANTIKLGAGNDTLDLTTNNGYNYVFGEEGDDNVKIDDIDQNDLVNLGAGTDTLTLNLNAGNSTAVLKGVENLVVKGDADNDRNVDINYADSALNVTLVAEEDNANLTILNLTAGSTVTVDPKKNTTNSVDILKVTYKNVEDSTTIKVNTVVKADTANSDDITIENVKNLTLEFAKEVDLETTDSQLVLNDKVENLTIKASEDFQVHDIVDGGTAGLQTITIEGQKDVSTGDITDEDKLTTLTATAKGDLTIGTIDKADKLTEVTLTGKSVIVGEIGDTDNGGEEADIPDELSSVTITATDGDVTLQTAGTNDDTAVIQAEKLGTVEIKADKGSILVDDNDDTDDSNVLISASDADGITIKLTAKTAIGDASDESTDGYGAAAGDDAVTIENTKGDVDVEVGGSATASLIIKAGNATYNDNTKGIVNLTASNTGGGAFDVYNDSPIADNKTSTLNLGNADTGKTNILKVEGVVANLVINGGSGNDTVEFSDPGNFANFKTATINLGQGTNKLDLSGMDLQYAPDGTDLGTDNGVVANFSSSQITIYGTDTNSSADDKTVDSLEIKLYDADGDEDATNTHQKVVEKSWTIDTNGITSFVGTSQADYIVANNTGMTIDAGGGNDTVKGGAGADTIDGGTGNDTIYGGDGGDTITGGAGNDKIYLGSNDGDADKVKFENTTDGQDVIYDYVAGTDKLLFDNTNFVVHGNTSSGIDITTAAQGSTKAAEAYEVICVTDNAAADWSDVVTKIDNAITVTDANADGNYDNDDKTIILIDNGTDTRVYYFNGDQDAGGDIDSNELNLIGTLDGISDCSSIDQASLVSGYITLV